MSRRTYVCTYEGCTSRYLRRNTLARHVREKHNGGRRAPASEPRSQASDDDDESTRNQAELSNGNRRASSRRRVEPQPQSRSFAQFSVSSSEEEQDEEDEENATYDSIHQFNYLSNLAMFRKLTHLDTYSPTRSANASVLSRYCSSKCPQRKRWHKSTRMHVSTEKMLVSLRLTVSVAGRSFVSAKDMNASFKMTRSWCRGCSKG